VIPDDRELGFERRVYETDDPAHQPVWRAHLLERSAALSAADVEYAWISIDLEAKLAAQLARALDPAESLAHRSPALEERPLVALALDPAGARKLADVTARALGEELAIVFEGRIVSTPTITMTIQDGQLRFGFPGGTLTEQRQLASEIVHMLAVGKRSGWSPIMTGPAWCGPTRSAASAASSS
jgi:preprotein translocase subunit SecD